MPCVQNVRHWALITHPFKQSLIQLFSLQFAWSLCLYCERFDICEEIWIFYLSVFTFMSCVFKCLCACVAGDCGGTCISSSLFLCPLVLFKASLHLTLHLNNASLRYAFLFVDPDIRWPYLNQQFQNTYITLHLLFAFVSEGICICQNRSVTKCKIPCYYRWNLMLHLYFY